MFWVTIKIEKNSKAQEARKTWKVRKTTLHTLHEIRGNNPFHAYNMPVLDTIFRPRRFQGSRRQENVKSVQNHFAHFAWNSRK